METVSLLQIVLGILVLASAISVVASKNPIVSAMMLMSTLFLTGAMYLGLGLYFIGAVQILIYAGAIAVLFVFIVMLLDLKAFRLRIPGRTLAVVLALVPALLLGASFIKALLPGETFMRAVTETAAGEVVAADPKVISLHFLSKYMLAFQMTGLLILGAIMGAVVLGKRKASEISGGEMQ